MAETNKSSKRSGNIFYRIFLSHPHSVNEGYFQHLRFAIWVASKLVWAGIAAIIHAFIPAWHEKTASKIIIELNELVQPRRQ